MKYCTLFILFCLSFSLSAQVEENEIDLSLGVQNAYVVDHIDAEKKMVTGVLEKTFKQYGKVKRNRKAGEWSCMDCKISMISTNPVNVYYKIEERKGLITSYVFIDDGTKFISSENDASASEAIERMNLGIYNDVKREVFKKMLKAEEDALKKFEKELSKLEKKNSDLHNDIESYKDKIVKAEKDIEKNLQSQEDKRIEIEQQKREVEKATKKLNNVGRGN